jgi:Fe-Mn family superoxide dismutase
MFNFIKYVVEGKDIEKLEQFPLSYPRDGLGKSISKQTMDYHYGKLYKSYVDRFNAGEGDADFNEAGAYLHSIYFSQFKSPSGSNKPTGASLEFIEKHFSTFDKFKDAMEKSAMAIQGSGWVYLAKDGKIKTIVNHEIKKDILLLIDWWEHSWALDYQADKAKYLNNIWRIIDWEAINSAITLDLIK